MADEDQVIPPLRPEGWQPPTFGEWLTGGLAGAHRAVNGIGPYAAQPNAPLTEGALPGGVQPTFADTPGVQPPPTQLQMPGIAGSGQLDPERASKLGDHLRRLRGFEGTIMSATKGMTDAFGALEPVQRAGLEKQVAIQEAASEGIGRQVGYAEAQQAKQENSLKTWQETRTAAQGKVTQALADAETMDRYAYADGTPEQIRANVSDLERTMNDPNASRKERVTAQRELQRMQEPNAMRQYSTFGRRVTAALAMAFGAYGAALTKTPNYAYQIITDAIERDLASQKERAASRRNDASRKIDTYKYLLNTAVSERQADLMYEASLIQTAMNITQLHMNNTDVASRAGQLRLTLDTLANDYKLKNEAAIVEGTSKAAQIELGAMNATVEEERVQAAKAAGAGKEIPHANDLVPIGNYDDKMKEQAQGDLRGYTRTRDAIRKLRSARSQWVSSGGALLPAAWTKSGNSLNAAFGQVADALRAWSDTGASLSKTEEYIRELEVGEKPTKWGQVDDRLVELEGMINDEFGQRLKNNNFKYAPQGEAQDAGAAALVH